MYRLTLCGVLAATLLVPSCSSPEEHTTEGISGAFKLMLRSQENHHSGIRNVDICVAEASAQKFPSGELQCFFHGFDFSGLSVGWRTGLASTGLATTGPSSDSASDPPDANGAPVAGNAKAEPVSE